MKIHLEKGTNPFAPIGPLYSTCSKNGKLAICPKYGNFVNRIKDYVPCMYEVITGYLQLDDGKFLLCFAGEDVAPEDVIDGFFVTLEDRTGRDLISENIPSDIYEKLNLEKNQDILFSIRNSEVISENIISTPIVIIETNFPNGVRWKVDILETDEKLLITIPDDIVPFEWKEGVV